MSLSLPLSGSPLRDFFDVADLLDLSELPDFPSAIRSARAFLVAEKAASAVNALAVRANGEIWLIKVGKRGGWKRIWNFSK